MHHVVRYVAEAPHRLHGLPAAVILNDRVLQVLLDREQIAKKLLLNMEEVAGDILAALTLRDTPSDEPWGRTHLPYVDSDDPRVMIPVITSEGIVLPVPHLITSRLARALEELSDQTMRLYHPPTT